MTIIGRRTVAALVASVAAVGTAFAALGRDGFVPGAVDLPLMPGLTELADRATIFDSAVGRVIEAYALGAVTRPAVLEFYARTLPQLGWAAAGAGEFRREGETLRIEFPAADAGPRGASGLVVRFFISPG